MKVAILCGGLGTRLGDLTRSIPKPMIDVGGRPYLERVVESFRNRGFRDFVMLSGYLPHVIESHFGDGSRFDVSIEYSVETTPLGTGGALREARHLLSDRFILTFGDVLRYFHYDHFVSKHPGNALAVYAVVKSTDNQPGNVELDGPRVMRFDKHAAEPLPFIDAGFSLMDRATIDLLPTQGSCSFEEIVYPALAMRGELEAEVVDHDFFDIGTPDELARTRAALETNT
jgi:D-glycero-D-manno-heptose 1,7-bisphosphate phosphatase